MEVNKCGDCDWYHNYNQLLPDMQGGMFLMPVHVCRKGYEIHNEATPACPDYVIQSSSEINPPETDS